MTDHPGIGKGHQPIKANLPVIREITATDSRLAGFIRERIIQPGTRSYRMGKARIFVSPPFGEKWGWHMTISRRDRYPDWDEIAKCWYELVPEAEQRFAVMVLPPKSEYINLHSMTLQIHTLVEGTVAGYTVRDGKLTR